jgi:cardiolipin synthase
MNIANFLSFFRLISPVFIILCHQKGFVLLTLSICFVAVISDFLDGYLARKFDLCTSFGALIDPVADKVFEMSMLSYCFYLDKISGFYLAIFLLRNSAQLSTIPILMWWRKIEFRVMPHFIAKCGSAVPSILILLIFVLENQRFMGGSSLVFVLTSISALVEIYMLITFIPRYIQVFQGKHNTFN